MEQRRVRLGDILDDYCPRERRLTNHAVVAMIDDQIKQTRCTTCDAEHPYKGGKVPPRRKKVQAAAVPVAPAGAVAEVAASDEIEPAPLPPPVILRPVRNAPTEPVVDLAPAEPARDEEVDDDRPGEVAARAVDDGPVHRRLIRATLPRPEGHVPERKIPEFTIREAATRGNQRPGARGSGGRPGAKFARPQAKAGRPGKGAHPRHGAAPGQHGGHKSAGAGGPRGRHHHGRGGKKSGR
jgi:hypothetical protein